MFLCWGFKITELGDRTYKDEHRGYAKEEHGNGRCYPVYAVPQCPPKDEQGERIHRIGKPHVLPHSVLGQQYEPSPLIVPVGLPSLARHNVIDPLATEEGGSDIAQARRSVEQADDELAVAVGQGGEGLLNGDVADEEGAEGDGGGEDGDGYGREA
jgi:hypothetical protein